MMDVGCVGCDHWDEEDLVVVGGCGCGAGVVVDDDDDAVDADEDIATSSCQTVGGALVVVELVVRSDNGSASYYL